MITQKFKGDALELQMEAAAKPAFDVVGLALDQMYDEAFEAKPFLLGLYDNGRAPFSNRVPRDAFPSFIVEALNRFPFTGSFESYIAVIKAIFGQNAAVLFEVTAPGKLTMTVSAADLISYDLAAVEFTTQLDENILLDHEGNTFELVEISGITSQNALERMMSELVPMGIFLTLTLETFIISFFLAEEGSEDAIIVDQDGNFIIFYEIGD